MRSRIAVAVVLSLIGVAGAQTKPAADDGKLIEGVLPSLAVAEFSVKPDNGEAPYGAGWGSRCPSCGQVHSNSVGDYVTQERPLEMPAFVVAPDLVVVPDPVMHGRFLQSIKVRQGDATVNATIAKSYTNHRAVLLKLEKPLPAAKPLVFERGDSSALKTVVYAEGLGQWKVTVSGFSKGLTQGTYGPQINTVTKDSLLLTADGKARGLIFSETLPADDTWQQPPLEWEGRTPEEQTALFDQLNKAIQHGIVRVHLGFRSPPANPQEQMGMRFGRDEEDNATERDVHGVVVAPNRVLVLATLKPDVTARLERVTIHAGNDAPVNAKFVCSLKDYGALIVEPASPLAPVPRVGTRKDLDRWVGPAFTLAEVRLAGENRTDYVSRVRFSGLKTGWRRNIFPELTLTDEQVKTSFVFNDDGALIALPLLVRPKPKSSDNSYSHDDPALTFTMQLTPVLDNPMAAADANNVPLNEEEQNRLAWLGVELQKLTPELARLNKVSQLTKDGESGGLVTYVYPESPAAKAGIQVGSVLLRVNAPDQPEPIEVTADEYMFAEREFPWDRYDQFPEAYFDRMPAPWPTAATTLARTLTEVGFGKTVTVELFQGGKVEKKPIEIAQGPTYFDSAKKTKHAPTGLTVRPMTYEVRRYFQLKPDAPGVLISRIEQGSRASKAGLKPYEFVTAVNGQPVTTGEEFLAAAEGQEELRLDVTRRNKSRVVKLKNDAAVPPTTAPATTQAAD